MCSQWELAAPCPPYLHPQVGVTAVFRQVPLREKKQLSLHPHPAALNTRKEHSLHFVQWSSKIVTARMHHNPKLWQHKQPRVDFVLHWVAHSYSFCFVFFLKNRPHRFRNGFNTTCPPRPYQASVEPCRHFLDVLFHMVSHPLGAAVWFGVCRVNH